MKQRPTPQPEVAAAAIEPAALKDNEFRVSEVPPGPALLVGNVAVFNWHPMTTSRRWKFLCHAG
jgi:hypothetical protein